MQASSLELTKEGAWLGQGGFRESKWPLLASIWLPAAEAQAHAPSAAEVGSTGWVEASAYRRVRLFIPVCGMPSMHHEQPGDQQCCVLSAPALTSPPEVCSSSTTCCVEQDVQHLPFAYSSSCNLGQLQLELFADVLAANINWEPVQASHLYLFRMLSLLHATVYAVLTDNCLPAHLGLPPFADQMAIRQAGCEATATLLCCRRAFAPTAGHCHGFSACSCHGWRHHCSRAGHHHPEP